MTIPKKPKNVDDFIAAASVPEANGLGMMEMKPRNGKAIREFERLVSKLYEGDVR